MKKFILIILCICSVCLVSAQGRHAKFLGIPLDCSITQFQQKMIQKGYKPNKELNRITPVGRRCFDGTFLGKEALIIIFYNDKTNLVYLGKAVYNSLKLEDANKELTNVMNLLYEKYKDATFYENTKNDLKSFYINSFPDFDGRINVYHTRTDDLLKQPYNYSLHIEYIDSVNYKKNEKREMEDL